MLKIKDVVMGYGDLQVLNGVSLEVKQGETVALVGSNGAGKTSLLRAISGLEDVWEGNITWEDKELTEMKAHKIAELRISHIPQGRGILTNMSVYDNLLLGAYIPEAKENREKVLNEDVLPLFPILEERLQQRAGNLSGGEQQMLAVARGLMMEPELMILDEPSLGLAPVIAEKVFKVIGDINAQGVSILLIEQNLVEAFKVASRGYVIETGDIVRHGPSEELLNDEKIREAYLGI